MTETLQRRIIARALELISDESAWTGGTLARDAHKRSCPVNSTTAVRFCAVGALSRASLELFGAINGKLVEQIEASVLAVNGVEGISLPSINDRVDHDVVVAMFQRALAA